MSKRQKFAVLVLCSLLVALSLSVMEMQEQLVESHASARVQSVWDYWEHVYLFAFACAAIGIIGVETIAMEAILEWLIPGMLLGFKGWFSVRKRIARFFRQLVKRNKGKLSDSVTIYLHWDGITHARVIITDRNTLKGRNATEQLKSVAAARHMDFDAMRACYYRLLIDGKNTNGWVCNYLNLGNRVDIYLRHP